MRFIFLITLCFSLFGCNSIYLKPGTLDKSQLVYAPRGGYSMQRTIKQTMEERGYNVSVGQLVRVSEISGNETYKIPKGARYYEGMFSSMGMLCAEDLILKQESDIQ